MSFKKSLMMSIVLIICIPVVSFAAEDQSYNMTGRLGIGANMALSGGMGLSGRYWLTDLISVEGIFNFTSVSVDSDAADSDSQYFGLAGRGTYSLFDYGKVHGGVGAGLAFGNMEIGDQDENFFGIEAYFQVENMINEFFSISGQTGLSFISADDTSTLSIGTPSFIGLFGFHFYF